MYFPFLFLSLNLFFMLQFPSLFFSFTLNSMSLVCSVSLVQFTFSLYLYSVNISTCLLFICFFPVAAVVFALFKLQPNSTLLTAVRVHSVSARPLVCCFSCLCHLHIPARNSQVLVIVCISQPSSLILVAVQGLQFLMPALSSIACMFSCVYISLSALPLSIIICPSANRS